jgi:S1-C subfamily serine protease
VNTIDLVLIGLALIAVLGGMRVGFVSRVATWAGLGLGVLAATWTVPRALELIQGGDPGVRLVAGLFVLAVTVTVVTSLFQTVGSHARRSIEASPLSRVDRIAGAAAGVAAVTAITWLLLPAASEVPGELAEQVRDSRMVAMVQQATPEPPDASRALRALVYSSRFPEVFADLQPPQVTGPPPEAIPVPQAVVDRVTAATVNISADGCGRRYEGSGFAVGAELVVTNAHVIAGADAVEVRRTDGERLPATPVAFDPYRDLALLEVPGLAYDPLPLARIDAGAEGAAIGYPAGQRNPRVAPLRVEERRTAQGRDIYDEQRTDRQILFLSADLRQGDSGSPVIDIDGRVGGVVFAISPDDPMVAYALDLTELEAIFAAPRVPGDTGPCLSPRGVTPHR